MAQDTRQYKSKEQDGKGNEIILRDQQLVEQASQTTMASGEYFEIVDVDGRMAKIPKDNMIGVVREALGSLLNGLSDQTTVTKIPTLNGNTLGASAAATLASVLGDQVINNTGPQMLPKLRRVNNLSAGMSINFGAVRGILYYRIGATPGLYLVNYSTITQVIAGSDTSINDPNIAVNSVFYKNSDHELIFKSYYSGGRSVDLWLIVCREETT